MRTLLLALCVWSLPARAAEPPAPAEDRRVVSELQSWGFPPIIQVHYRSRLAPPKPPADAPKPPADGAQGQPESRQRALTLYFLDEYRPTALGRRLHERLSALSDGELARLGSAQLERALSFLEEAAGAEGDARRAEAFTRRAAELLASDRRETPLGLSRPARATGDVLLKHRPLLEAARVRAVKQGDKRRADQLQEALRALELLTGRLSEPASGPLTHAALLALIREIPEHALSPAQWDALARSFPLRDSLSRLDSLRLWRRGITGRGVRVAVLDTGVDPAHPDLAGYARHGRNFTADIPEGYHGTHVAGIVHGLAPEAEIVSYKVLDCEGSGRVPYERQLDELATIRATAAALRLAADEAEADGVPLVVNLSLGWSAPKEYSPDGILFAAIAELARRGVIVAASTGNEGAGTLRTPAASPNALAIGAVDYARRQAEFSSRDDRVDERGALREAPDLLAYGVRVNAAYFDRYDGLRPGIEYAEDDGTSMAAPHVSAAVALILQDASSRGVSLGFEEVRELLLSSAAPALEGPYGRGIADPAQSCRIIDMAANLVFVRRSCLRRS